MSCQSSGEGRLRLTAARRSMSRGERRIEGRDLERPPTCLELVKGLERALGLFQAFIFPQSLRMSSAWWNDVEGRDSGSVNNYNSN